MIAAIVISFIYLIAASVLTGLLLQAPSGYEDASGFHLGKEPVQH